MEPIAQTYSYHHPPRALSPGVLHTVLCVPLRSLRAGIPAGSIASGASGLKSMEERATFGGIADTQYDSCYHRACDTVANINLDSLAELSGAAAFVTMQVVQTRDPAGPAAFPSY